MYNNKTIAFIFALLIGFTSPVAPAHANSAEDQAEAALERAKANRTVRIQERRVAESEAELERLRESQRKAQEDARNNKQAGANAANMLGIGLMAAGTIMVIIGSNPPPGGNPAMLPPGLFMIAGGLGAMMAGAAMNQNAGQNQGFANNLGSLAPPDPKVNPGFNVDNGTDPRRGKFNSNRIGSSVAINSDDLRNGTLGEIFDKFEAETGLNRENFARSLLEGKSPSELLDGKVNDLTKEQLEKGIQAAQSNLLAGDGFQSELEELAKEAGLDELYAKMNDSNGTDFKGASRGLAGGSKKPVKKFDFNSLKEPSKVEQKFDLAKTDFDKLSDEVKAQLLKEGRVGISLFDMVARQYRKKTPLLFGQDPDVVFEGVYNLDKLDDEEVFNDL